MKLACPYFDDVLCFEENSFCSVVIENRNIMRLFLEDMNRQIEENTAGKIILSEKGEGVNMAKFCDVISDFAPFEINQKKLLSAVTAAFEGYAVGEGLYVRTQTLISEIEKYIQDISFDLECNVICTKLTPNSLIKSCGIEMVDDYDEPLEKVLDYMDFMQKLRNVKLFVTVNMRNYYEDDDIQRFCNSVTKHKISLLMIEACSYSLLENEKRITIDEDMCVF